MAELRHRIRVRYSDCDPQGVVFNANYLTYFDIAMTELWREALGPYDEVMREHGVDMVVAEATVRYRAPVRFDEEVDLVAQVSRLGNTSMLTALTIEADARTAAEGELRHVFIDPGNGEKAAIPNAIRTALEDYVPSESETDG